MVQAVGGSTGGDEGGPVQADSGDNPPLASHVSGQNVVVVGHDLHGDVVFNTEDSAFAVDGLPNPYLGLESFTYQTRERFGGREQQVEQAAELLTRPGDERTLLFVTGSSGSGKSSFAQAGLVPALEQRYRARNRPVRWAVLRPGAHPLAALCVALETLGIPPQPLKTPAELNGLLAEQTPPGQVNLLVLDQFEEVFTQSEGGERDALLGMLVGLASFGQIRTHVIATMRADYLPAVFSQPPLFELVKRSGIELRGMTADELRRAIQRPVDVQNAALHTHVRWQPELIERLVADTVGEATLLPLLQVTLESIWQHGRLTLDRYNTLTDALEEKAEAAYQYTVGVLPQRARTPAECQAVLRIFLDLVEVSLDDDARRDVRRSLPKAELIQTDPERAALIDELVGARLLSVEPRGLEQVDTVDIIHETLLRSWDRLRNAIREQRAALQQREEFRLAVREWSEHGRSDGYLVEGVRLAEARALKVRGDVALQHPDAREFLTRSIARAERQRWRLLMASGVVSLVLLATTVVSLIMSQRAVTQQRIGEARELAAYAEGQLTTDPERSLLLALQAVDRAPSGTSVREAEDALRHAYLLSNHRLSVSHPGLVVDAALTDDGRVASASQDGTVHLSPLAAGAAQTVATGIEIDGLTVSRDGSKLLLYGSDGAGLWDARQGAKLLGPLKSSGRLRSAALSPDGRWLAIGGDTLAVWDATTGIRLANLTTRTSVLAVAFSPDGERVAAAGNDGHVQVWAWQTSAAPLVLAHDGPVNAVAFSPDGSMLLTASQDNTARLWDANTGQQLADFPHDGAVTAASFSADGSLVATASEDTTAHVWNVASRRLQATLLGHTGSVVSARFDPLAGRVVTASTDGSARVWDARSGAQLSLLAGHTAGLTDAAFSPDGLRVVTSSWDGTARVWDTPTGLQPPVLRALKGGLTGVAFSPDGRVLVTAGAQDGARVWDAATGNAVRDLSQTTGASTAAFSADGQWAATGATSGEVRVWDWRTGQSEAVLSASDAKVGAVNRVVFSPDSTRLGIAGNNGRALVWTWNNGSGALVELGAACDTGANGGCRHQGPVSSIAFSDDGTRVVTASSDTTARVWDAATGRLVLAPLRHANQLTDAIFWGSARVITASKDRTAHVWDLPGGQEEAGFVGHTGIITSLALSRDGRWLVTGSYDQTARVWETATRTAYAVFHGPSDTIWQVSVSPDAQPRIAVASGDGAAWLFECAVCVDLPTLRNLAANRATRDLSADERRQFLHQ